MPLNKETYTKDKELSLSCYLSIAERIVGFIPFPKLLAAYEMQTA